MELLLSIDDTDNLESPGTGKLLEAFRAFIEQKGLGKTKRITRHQLFFHPDIPYTSHNSSMCFSMETEWSIDEIRVSAAEYLERVAAQGSDPGLAVADPQAIFEESKLIGFGRAAKRSVLTKRSAYDLATECGVSLTEHGGTGDGVIGALAAIGLRLEGSDGRFRGALEGLRPGGTLSVEQLRHHPDIDDVNYAEPSAIADRGSEDVTPDETRSRLSSLRSIPPGRASVVLDEKVKVILANHRALLLIKRTDERDVFANWSKEELKIF